MSDTRDFDLHDELRDSRRYECQIDRLHARFVFTRYLYELRQEGVSLASLIQRKSTIARLLAKTVGRGEYRFEPATTRTIVVDDKARVVYALGLLDSIVHGVVARVIDEALSAHISKRLYSYRKDVSWITPVADFASYVRAHRRSRPDPRTRGIYVLRRDIDSYTDSIPLAPRSRVWSLLRDILQPEGSPTSIRAADWKLIETVVRPEVVGEGGRPFTLLCGVATGQPISCVLFNLYLVSFDHEFAAMPGAFYGRYSDDVLFAHPDAAVVREVDRRIDARLSELELKVNAEKRQDLYLTGAGRRSAEWSAARGTTTVPFLGCRVSATGTISLGKKKTRRLLRDLGRRALRTVRAYEGADRDTIGRLVCAILNRVLDPRTAAFQQRSAALLRRAITDRQQLKQLDHLLARLVVRAVTGEVGARAFRSVAYRKIREDWKLLSVQRARNAWPAR